ncbi:family 43 glycosylhydrolase [Aestuariicella hydrocarbonica]|uniref:Family 43 glycosylhydrolase n=1 Tax=Pseudomaricurvus hydrocarbonicus TaxID=1470433 RepID=A0A9E5MNC1_9GAMM|nr:family 43 glycosylhydrolase [Aestuariicella hydrocarbonica]NHO67400.1 family 43 glycosylhydrolase [Aestuariicella hydrocarbonica]
MSQSRRHFMKLGLAGVSLASLPSHSASADHNSDCGLKTSLPEVAWGTGYEGQRIADLDNGSYLNPILSGDYPDPTILQDGDDYYMTHSSFEASPGLLIWHSKDLVNWRPLVNALEKPLGIVFAVDLVKHNDHYYLYIPFMKAPWSTELKDFANIYVIHAPSIEGPWSEPIDLGIYGLIDPGHAVGEDGNRYLFLSGVNRVQLAANGLSTIGSINHVYDGWQYPSDWITEAYALEGPKIFKRGQWFYLISAVGGTAGPATGHMVIAARAKSINGPWQNCPHNPIIRTADEREYWWSRGHATFVMGPNDQWYMVYHGYENGFRTLGRQTLLEPVEWSSDGWPIAMGGDLSVPLPLPASNSGIKHGMKKSDDFDELALGTRWTLFNADPNEPSRVTVSNNRLMFKAQGDDPGNSSPLVVTVGDKSYECSVTMTLEPESQGGLLLFYNNRLFLGMGCDGKRMHTYRGGKLSYWQEPVPSTRKIELKIRNENNIVSFYYREHGKEWTRHMIRSEVSGYNANTADDLQGLKPALFSAGEGTVEFSNFKYRAI